MKRHIKPFEDFSVNEARTSGAGRVYMVTYDGPPVHAPDGAGQGEVFVSFYYDARSAKKDIKKKASSMARQSLSAFGGTLREYLDIFEHGFEMKEIDTSDEESVLAAFEMIMHMVTDLDEEDAAAEAFEKLVGIGADPDLILKVDDPNAVYEFLEDYVDIDRLPESRLKASLMKRRRGKAMFGM